MSQYIHHVPGRIRVRSRAFRCREDRAHAAERRLKAMAGVTQTRVNPHAGSITVHYDTAVLTRSDILTILEHVGCLEAAIRSEDGAQRMGEMFGKALVGAVVQKAMERSARTLVSAFI